MGIAKKRVEVGYTHLPKRPDTINSSPKMIRPIATSNTIVATPIAGYTSATKPNMTASTPTIIIPGVPRTVNANPRKINVKATSQPRVNPPQKSGAMSIPNASKNAIIAKIAFKSRCHPEMPSEKIRTNSMPAMIRSPTARNAIKVAAVTPG